MVIVRICRLSVSCSQSSPSLEQSLKTLALQHSSTLQPSHNCSSRYHFSIRESLRIRSNSSSSRLCRSAASCASCWDSCRASCSWASSSSSTRGSAGKGRSPESSPLEVLEFPSDSRLAAMALWREALQMSYFKCELADCHFPASAIAGHDKSLKAHRQEENSD